MKYDKDLFKLKLCIWTLALSLIFCSTVKAYSIDIRSKTNMVYKQIINYTIPMVKVTTTSQNDKDEKQFSLKNKVLELLGVYPENPLSIMEKEVSYLKGIKLENIEGREEDLSLNPFKLGESSIGKLNAQTGEGQKTPQDENIPNKEVTLDNPNLPKSNTNPAKPQIFIYFSHTTEGYGIGSTDDTTDNNKNVTAVGAALSKELQDKYGISVVVDTTVHNVPDYNGSYGKSAQTVEKYLKSYGDFKLVIDMHRDSTPNRNAVITKLNGETVARYMFVMAKKNPHFDKNIAVVNKLIGISEKLFPGLARDSKDGKGIYYVNYGIDFYNQGKSNNSVLIEMGSNFNTVKEAEGTTKYLARIFAEYVNTLH
jgi:stage II sporulation protein P